jgi:hypothetical protein
MRFIIALIFSLTLAPLCADEMPLRIFTIVPGADVLLKDDFGVMLINDGNEDAPVPRYIFAIRKSRTLLDTRDVDLFRTALKQVPKGTKLVMYDSCTVPRSWGLRQSDRDLFQKTITKAGLSFSEEEKIAVCYCDAIKKHHPETPVKPTKPADKKR